MSSLDMVDFALNGFSVGDFGEGVCQQGLARLRVNAEHAALPDAEPHITAARDRIQARFVRDDLPHLPESWQTNEIGDDVLRWAAGADDAELVAFMTVLKQHHGAQEAMLRDELPRIADATAEWLGGLAVAYQSGPRVLYEVGRALHQLELAPLNSFDAGRLGADGVTNIAPDHALGIAVAASVFKRDVGHTAFTPRAIHLAGHEGIHAALANMQAGFYDGLNDSEPHGLLEEMGIECQVRTPGGRDFDVFDPAAGGYTRYYERQYPVWAVIAQGGRRVITPQFLCQAMATPRSHNDPGTPRALLRWAIDINTRELLPEFADTGFRGLSQAHADRYPHERPAFMAGLLRQAQDNADLVRRRYIIQWP